MSLTPHPDLVKILQRNKCKISFKSTHNSIALWIKYNDLINSKPAKDFTVYGNAQEAFENVAKAVRTFYPTAELSSQDGRGSVVYTVNNIKPVPTPSQTQQPPPALIKPGKHK